MKYVLMTLILAGCQLGPGLGPKDRGFIGDGGQIVTDCDPGDAACVVGVKDPSGLAVGLQNFRELYRSSVNLLELTSTEERTLTGGTGTPTLFDYYTGTAKSILASKGVANEASNSLFFSSAILSANMAGIFVRKDLAKAEGSRLLLNGVNSGNPASQLSSALIDEISNRTYQKFVGRMPSPIESEAIRQQVQECAAAAGGQTALVQNQNCLIVLIAGIMNSIDSLKI